MQWRKTGVLLCALGLLLSACDKQGNTAAAAGNSDTRDGSDACYVELFDGSHFRDDHIRVQGPGEFSNLDSLPHADGKKWTNEADSLKYGAGAVVTIWWQTDFKGNGRTLSNEGGGALDSVDEPYSMKIKCRT